MTQFDVELASRAEAVKDNPADETHRLRLADWLESHGRDDAERERAVFMRLQFRRAQLLEQAANYQAATSQGEYQELIKAEDQLRKRHVNSWLGAWKAWMQRPDIQQEWFVRGFLRPRVEDLKWLDAMPADHAGWSLVDGLETAALSLDDVQRLAQSPVLRHLNTMGFGPDTIGIEEGSIGPEGAAALAVAPHLCRLTQLNLSDCLIGPEGAARLAASPICRRLTHLDLGGWDCTPSNNLGDEGVLALARSAKFTQLTYLNLMENSITTAGLCALAGAPQFSTLTRLELGNNPLDLDGTRALAESPYLTQLQFLGVEFLTTSPDARRKMDESELEQAKQLLKGRFGDAVVFRTPTR